MIAAQYSGPIGGEWCRGHGGARGRDVFASGHIWPLRFRQDEVDSWL